MSPSPKTLNKGAELLKQTKPRAPQCQRLVHLLAQGNWAVMTLSLCSPGGISERASRCPGVLWGTHMLLWVPTHDPPKQRLQL